MAIPYLSAQEVSDRVYDPVLSQYMQDLNRIKGVDAIADPRLQLESANALYDQLENNTLSAADKRQLYALIIDKVVRDQLSPEVKVLYLYLIEKHDVVATTPPLYRLNKFEVLEKAGEDMQKHFPDIMRGAQLELTENHQNILVKEALDGLRSKGVDVAGMLALFK